MDQLVTHLMSVYGFSQADALKVAQHLGAAPPSPQTPPPQGSEYDIRKAMSSMGVGPTPSAQTYIGPNLPPKLDKALHTGINKGLAAPQPQNYSGPNLPPVVDKALHTGINKSFVAGPGEDPWHAYATEHPVLGMAKNELVQAGRFLRHPLGHPDTEKLSAQKMLKDYLQAQEQQRAGEAQKDTLNSALSDAQAWDTFFTQTGRPPSSLGDFVQAGAMRQGIPPAKLQGE